MAGSRWELLPELLVSALSLLWLVWIGWLFRIATAGLWRGSSRFRQENVLTRQDIRLLRRLHIRP